ncbi:MAG: D-2-hydroxyacid dehydrogenase [Firmicutes bacterium]|nr:D-2-hydroxyacid dehydrogenase [Bacillota bacterium]
MGIQICSFTPLSPLEVRLIEAVSPEVSLADFGKWTGDERQRQALARSDVVLAWTARFTRADAPRTRWFHGVGAGVDHLLSGDLFRGGDVILTNSSGVHAAPISEFVMANMLALARKLPRLMELKREHRWPSGQRGEFMVDEVAGKTVGIVGYGNIGRQVAARARAFGMRVLGLHSGRPRAAGTLRWGAVDIEPDAMYQPGQLHEMLTASDFVVLSVAATAQTAGLIGLSEFRAMKPTAYLINVSRGSVVVEEALIRAVREGLIAGAALDVFEQEPLPPDSPFYDLPNVIVSPHVAGLFSEFTARMADLFVENLRRFLAGEPMYNVVDPERGY